jgi:ribosomal protein S18 acetylase RimI-like enzyme
VTHVTFRFADSADIPELVALVESAYRGDSSRQGWTTEADLLEGQRIDAEGVQADIDRADSLVLLVVTEAGSGSPVTDTSLLGCVHIARTAPGLGYLGMFAVRPGGQGLGLGKRILAEAERRMAQDWAITTVEMTVLDARTELLAFYERRGYVRTGEHKAFPYGDERYGLPLRDDLRMEILRKDLLADVSRIEAGRPPSMPRA